MHFPITITTVLKLLTDRSINTDLDYCSVSARFNIWDNINISIKIFDKKFPNSLDLLTEVDPKLCKVLFATKFKRKVRMLQFTMLNSNDIFVKL